jgi:uncharacterized hydrophobic protein (TIGR00271 family)
MGSEPAQQGQTPAYGFDTVLHSWRHWWWSDVVGTVDQAEVIAGRREESDLTARYLFMLAMSAGIAILGLLLSSPAVVIGAMLLSPLMGPIIGLGFALATGHFGWMKQAGRSLVTGTLLAVVFCALVSMLSPLQTVTPEIAARTRPNLFDLLVALFSALAGAYAMIRGREGTVVGVAIATALMPPLAVVGFGLATFNWTVFSGALLLYVTNLMTIALTATVMARLYGFGTHLTERQTYLQTFLVVTVFIGLAIPLGYSLRQIAWETNAAREINAAVLDAFDNRARLSQIEVNHDRQPIQVTATVLTPQLRPEAERATARAIASRLGTPVDVAITQYQVGTSASAAEQAQLSAARAREAADVRHAEALAERLALIAGVGEGDVLVDRERRRALVSAQPLDGATLAAYRELERRISATEAEWRITLRPPTRPLPAIAMQDGEPTRAGAAAIDLAVWAGQRLELPVVVQGQGAAAARVRALLAERGLATIAGSGRSPAGEVVLRWASPEESQREEERQ